MSPGLFERKLKKLNSKLIILSNGVKQSLYYNTYDGVKPPEHICGVDRNNIPEFILYDKQGHIIKAGWRRTLEVLISNNLVSKNKAEVLFHCVLDGRNSKMTIEEDPISRAIRQAGKSSEGNIADMSGIDMKRDDLIDISKMIKRQK